MRRYNDIKNIADECFDRCDFDFVVSRELEQFYLRQYTKTNILRELGENHPFTFAFPNLITNQMFFKKTNITMEFVKELCHAYKNKEWADPNQYGDLHSDFGWSAAEQGVFGTIIANWIRTRKYEIPLKYPQIKFRGRSIYKIRQNKNYGYLKYLD